MRLRDPAPGVILRRAVGFVVFMLGVAALGTLVYLALFLSHVPGAKEERFGDLEPLPDRVGEWCDVGESDEGDLVRQERYLVDERGGTLLHQVRVRHRTSGEVVSVEPERRVKRRRVRRR